MPKHGLDVAACEVYRFYKLVTLKGLIEPISMIVPRRVSVFFHHNQIRSSLQKYNTNTLHPQNSMSFAFSLSFWWNGETITLLGRKEKVVPAYFTNKNLKSVEALFTLRLDKTPVQLIVFRSHLCSKQRPAFSDLMCECIRHHIDQMTEQTSQEEL